MFTVQKTGLEKISGVRVYICVRVCVCAPKPEKINHL